MWALAICLIRQCAKVNFGLAGHELLPGADELPGVFAFWEHKPDLLFQLAGLLVLRLPGL